MSSSVHVRKRELGGDMRIAMGEGARDDAGVSKRFGAGAVDEGTRREDLREPGGEP